MEDLPEDDLFTTKTSQKEEHPLVCFSECTDSGENNDRVDSNSRLENTECAQLVREEESSRVFLVEDEEPMTFEMFTKLHENFGHPSKYQMALLLKRGKYPETIWRPLLDIENAYAFRCSFCTGRSNGRVPSRPKVSYPKETGPGQSLHVDVGEFRHPTNGNFLAVL